MSAYFKYSEFYHLWCESEYQNKTFKQNFRKTNKQFLSDFLDELKLRIVLINKRFELKQTRN